jgi:hypothetical protein
MDEATRRLIDEMARDVVARACTDLRDSPPASGQVETCCVECSELALHVIEALETWEQRHGK